MGGGREGAGEHRKRAQMRVRERGAQPATPPASSSRDMRGSRTIYVGVRVGRCWPRSSKPVTPRSAWRGGFDSHALPPRRDEREKMATETRPRPPSVHAVLAAVPGGLRSSVRSAALTAAARAVVDAERRRLDAGQDPTSIDGLAVAVAARLASFAALPLDNVINATGVIVHTNLGRAPWPAAAIEAAAAAAGGYLMLELDAETGRRGARFREGEEHLIALTGAEDGLVTNNNAAALALAVGLAGRGRGVAVSRGELVEIGGGVRIPDIVRRAGARLIEVGTTNRTRVGDFAAPLEEGRASVVLRVHPSNFHQQGF